MISPHPKTAYVTDQPPRTRYNIGARKIAYEDRTTAHEVLTESDQRGFLNIIDADDDDRVPLGAPVTYSVELTPSEADKFREARNCRFVEEDAFDSIDMIEVSEESPFMAASGIPPVNTMEYMGANLSDLEQWQGLDVPIAILDGGTSQAVKTRFEWKLLQHRNFITNDPDPNIITVEHGCYVTPEAVPAGGKLIEAVIFDKEGYSRHSNVATALRWAADNGAKVINYSGSGSSNSSVQNDAIVYLKDRGVVLVCSAGNDGEHTLQYPAKLCEQFPNVKSSIAFVESTDLRATFSNYAETGSGCAPGSRCLSVNKSAKDIVWSGTSSSSPKQARLIAMGCSSGHHEALTVARALEVNARNTPAPTVEEGAGAWHLENALRKLRESQTPTPEPPLPVESWVTRLLTAFRTLWRFYLRKF
jgi:Subtilase family